MCCETKQACATSPMSIDRLNTISTMMYPQHRLSQSKRASDDDKTFSWEAERNVKSTNKNTNNKTRSRGKSSKYYVVCVRYFMVFMNGCSQNGKAR